MSGHVPSARVSTGINLEKQPNRLKMSPRKKPVLWQLTDNNRLSIVNPELSKEWDDKKNGALRPENITAHSALKVWWRCERGHEWVATVDHRSNGRGCPACKHLLDDVGKSLGRKFPYLVGEWNSEKNASLTCFDVMPFSGRKVWWRCQKGHEWVAEIKQRTRFRSGCPYCSGLKADSSTCLASVNPNLAKEWHPTKNFPMTPLNTRFGSSKRVWWICQCGHEWQAGVGVRNFSQCRCPECSKSVVLKDGIRLQSLTEAYFYLLFSDSGEVFEYNKVYPNSRFRYDFYFPKANKYVEVTSFNRRSNKNWRAYLKKIVLKKKIACALGASFEFIQRELKGKELAFVKGNLMSPDSQVLGHRLGRA